MSSIFVVGLKYDIFLSKPQQGENTLLVFHINLNISEQSPCISSFRNQNPGDK